MMREIINQVKWFLSAIRDIFRSHYIDKKLGINTTGIVRNEGIGKNKDGIMCAPTSYYLLNQIYTKYIKTNDRFLDLGCGKGRAVCFMLSKKVPAVGVELDPVIFLQAKKNIEKMGGAVTNEDATVYSIKDETVIFMNQPFGYKTTKSVAENIKKSLLDFPRELTLVYVHGWHRHLFEDFMEFKGNEINNVFVAKSIMPGRR